MSGERSNGSPQLFTNYLYKWLENALDYGLSELEFWEMTIAELERYIASRRRVEKVRAQEKASFDYILADLIGKSIGRIYSSANKLPEISEAYPSLFDSKEIQEQKETKKMELSVLRFKHFAQSYNNKFREGSTKE